MKYKYDPVTVGQKLGYLVEECGEVLAAVGRTQHWGLERGGESQDLKDTRETNRKWLLRELDCLEHACTLLRKALDEPMD